MVLRFLDVCFASLALIVLSPLFIPTVIVLRLTGEGEVFFLQSRVGRYGEMFGLIKFATMLKNSENMPWPEFKSTLTKALEYYAKTPSLKLLYDDPSGNS